MTDISWSQKAWKQYLEWQETDRKKLQRINMMIRDILRNGPVERIGKPEALRYRNGYSRRIDEENRLVYDVCPDGSLRILSCKRHYEE